MMNYTTYVSQISDLTVIASTSVSVNFQTFINGCIDYAEQRIYRETDLLATVITDATTSLSSNNRNFSLPTSQGIFLTVDKINVITPAGTPSSAGTRVPLSNTSWDFIDAIYPGNGTPSTPQFWAMKNNTSILVGPVPDASYVVEVVGEQRPTPLSVTNSSTILTQMLPDLFIAASMVYASGYMRDFGGNTDDPQQGNSWEQQYQKLFQSAYTEEVRKRHMSQGWTSQLPNQIATPQRV
jgi:hypothetical protein